MKLYHYLRSSAAYRTRIAFNLKGIPHEQIDVDLRTAASEQRQAGYLAINPQGLVPALVTHGTTLAQSLAIIEYLDETHPEPPLLPRSPLERAQVRAMAFTVACDIHPLNNLRVLNYLREPLQHDEDAVNAWYRHWIAAGFRSLEQLAHASGDQRHMFGTQITLADICIVPQMYNARRFKCDLDPYPTLRAVCAHLDLLPAFAQASPDAQRQGETKP